MLRGAGLAWLVALGLSLGACGGSSSSSSTSSTTTATTSTSTPSASVSATTSSTATAGAAGSYSLVLQKSFLASCDRTSSGKLAYCRCTLTHIEMVASQAKFEADIRALVNGTKTLPRYVIDAEHACGA